MPDELDSFVELHWIPVGAGTHFQRLSLILYEALAAAVSRRARAELVHAGLKGTLRGEPFTLELMPSPPGPNRNKEVTGPVGIAAAGRFRLFRYQVCVLPNAALPDERWAVEPAVRLADESELTARVLDLAKQVPAYTWGRRRPGHSEMWTSDSAVSWVLTRAGIHADRIRIPAGCRAPGWRAGLQEASSKGAATRPGLGT